MDKEMLELVLKIKEEEIKAKIRECLAISYDSDYIMVKDDVRLAKLLDIKLDKKKGGKNE